MQYKIVELEEPYPFIEEWEAMSDRQKLRLHEMTNKLVQYRGMLKTFKQQYDKSKTN